MFTAASRGSDELGRRLQAVVFVEAEVLWRHVSGEPDAVGRQIEDVLPLVHRRGIDGEDDGLTTAGSDIVCGVAVRREVDVLAASSSEAVAHDAGEETLDGPVKQLSGRLTWGQTEVHGAGVSLRGPDAVAHDLEALLEAMRGERVDLVAGDATAMCGQGIDQEVDVDPAALVQFDPDGLGAVTQDMGQSLRQGREPISSLRSTVHPCFTHPAV